jgi:hypothetical protein
MEMTNSHEQYLRELAEKLDTDRAAFEARVQQKESELAAREAELDELIAAHKRARSIQA